MKKDETPTKEEHKFVYVPKVPRAKANTPIPKRVETMKTLEETSIFSFNETPIDFPPFDFIPRSISLVLYLRNLLRLVVLLKIFLMIMMVQ